MKVKKIEKCTDCLDITYRITPDRSKFEPCCVNLGYRPVKADGTFPEDCPYEDYSPTIKVECNQHDCKHIKNYHCSLEKIHYLGGIQGCGDYEEGGKNERYVDKEV